MTWGRCDLADGSALVTVGTTGSARRAPRGLAEDGWAVGVNCRSDREAAEELSRGSARPWGGGQVPPT